MRPLENENAFGWSPLRRKTEYSSERWCGDIIHSFFSSWTELGEVIRLYATGTDIDDRKQAEERTRKENLALREEIDHSSMFEEIIGSSPALRQVLRQVAKVAPTDSTSSLEERPEPGRN